MTRQSTPGRSSPRSSGPELASHLETWPFGRFLRMVKLFFCPKSWQGLRMDLLGYAVLSCSIQVWSSAESMFPKSENTWLSWSSRFLHVDMLSKMLVIVSTSCTRSNITFSGSNKTPAIDWAPHWMMVQQLLEELIPLLFLHDLSQIILNHALVTFPRSLNLELIQGDWNEFRNLQDLFEPLSSAMAAARAIFEPKPCSRPVAPVATHLGTGTTWNLMWDKCLNTK